MIILISSLLVFTIEDRNSFILIDELYCIIINKRSKNNNNIDLGIYLFVAFIFHINKIVFLSKYNKKRKIHI